MYYFAYGTNVNKRIFLNRFKGSIFFKTHTIKGYSLVFRSKSGLPDLKSNLEAKTCGIIYLINPLIEKKLDEYEEYPKIYIKKYLKYRNKKIMFYVMKKKTKPTKPSRYYLKVIKEGYRQNNFKFNLY